MQELKSIAYHTLGCKLNFSETSTLARLFEEKEFVKKEFKESADVYVINTCSVTENADKECKQLIRRVKKQNPDATIVITGCYAQLKSEEIAGFENVDLVIGTSEKFKIAEHVSDYLKGGKGGVYSCDIDEVQGFHSSWSMNDRTRTFLKVQDGCDYNCSFCTIPLARGHSRSDTIANVLENTKSLAASGVQEVVLTGVNLGDFGKGFKGNRTHEENFFDLIKALDAQGAIPRFRISSIEPNLLSDEIIQYVGSSKHFMPHFHIPLQSGSNTLLSTMRRRYRRELYSERVNTIKSLMPHACIGVDVIVGFPGETDTLFEETYAFLKSIDISYLHVFTYSERENTLAVELPGVVPMNIRKARNAKLRELSEEKMQAFTEQHKGSVRPVLFEHTERDGMMEGYSDNYIRVEKAFDESLVNRICNMKL